MPPMVILGVGADLAGDRLRSEPGALAAGVRQPLGGDHAQAAGLVVLERLTSSSRVFITNGP